MVRLLGSMAESNAWHLETATSGWEAMERMQSGAVSHLLVLDIPRRDADTLYFLRWLSRLRPNLSVVMLCYPDDASRLNDAASVSGGEIVVRPFDVKQLESVIQRHLALAGAGVDPASKNAEQSGQDVFFVSASPIMQKLCAQAALLAKTDVPVLILGETGAGKHTVASLIHKLSVRSGFKLLRVNCAEMPEAVLEAELFGNDRDSSARQTRLGKFAAGEKGTIFLEEVAAMSPVLQSRLLQVLQNQVLQNELLSNNDLRTPGNSEAMPADVRILAGSCANLDRVLSEGQLREDLYYLLSAFTVQVPPLRQRKDEISILLRYFMHKLAKHYSLPPRDFSPSAFAACQRYSWPGNLDELEAFVKRYLVAGDQGVSLSDIRSNPGNALDDNLADQGTLAAALPERSGSLPAPAETESLKSLVQGIKSEAERNAIGVALLKTGWNRKAAARLLRVSYRTLLYKIEQYQMRAPQPYLSTVPEEEFRAYDNVKGNGKAS